VALSVVWKKFMSNLDGITCGLAGNLGGSSPGATCPSGGSNSRASSNTEASA
jgi:hypothetical protein